MTLTPRQRQFADAGLSIMDAEGLPGVTFRRVAAQAGMSVGAVQKAFPAKADLLVAMLERMRDRAAEPAIGEPGRPTLREWLCRLTLQILPLDEERRRQELRSEEFSQAALHDPGLASRLEGDDSRLRSLIASLVGRAVAEGEIAPTDPEAVASAWLAYFAGLTAQLVLAPRDEASVAADVGWTIDRLLGPTVPSHDRPSAPE